MINYSPSKQACPTSPVAKPYDRRKALKAIGTGLITAPIILKTSIVNSAVNSGVPFIDLKSDAEHRVLNLFNSNTREHISTAYWKNGQYDSKSLSHFDYLMRDHRAGESRPIATKIFDLLYAIQKKFGDRELHIVSGYRTEETNNMLRRRSRGVAKQSYHIRGMAVDMRIPGIPTKKIRHFAQSQRVGGVGWYPRSGFVHLDTGPVRYW